MAIEDLISPLSQDRRLAPWQQELLIESLLVQEVPHLALHVLRAPGPAIQPLLEIKTLLANNLVAEAFQLQRSKGDKKLLLEFFRGCHEQNKWRYVLDLALTPNEELCLGQFLRSSESVLGENLHFLYLLQRAKYIEATSFIDQLQSRRKGAHHSDLETPHTILSAYKLTMTPATRQMSDIFYSLKDNINTRLNKDDGSTPNPLSSKLLQRKMDLIGGVYHRSVLSTEQTTRSRAMSNLTTNNIPFLRNPQYDMSQQAYQQMGSVSYPEEYVSNPKRNLNDSMRDDVSEADQGPKKRRRLNSIQTESLSKRQNQMTVLTSFRERPSSTFLLSKKDVPCTTHSSRHEESNSNDTDSNTTLSTPIVQNFKETNKLSPNQYPERVSTPHSILKVKHVNDSPLRSSVRRSLSPYLVSDRRSMESDERSIRFALPQQFSTESEITVQPIASSTVLESPHSMNTSYRQSLNISGASILSTSVDEFYSPDASQEMEKMQHKESIENISSHKRQHINETSPVKLTNNDRSAVKDYSPRNFSDGPRPRKRLRSSTSPDPQISNCLDVVANIQHLSRVIKPQGWNAEKTFQLEDEQKINESPVTKRSTRSRSKTPDVQIPVTRILTRSRSKTPEVELAPSLSFDILKNSTPMRRKPLSRIVLEANAKKITSQLAATEDISPIDSNLSVQAPNSVLDDTVEDSSSTILLYADNSQPLLPDCSKISDSFMDRWNKSDTNSTLNNSSFNESSMAILQQHDAILSSDSDSSFVFVKKIQDVITEAADTTAEVAVTTTEAAVATTEVAATTKKPVERVIIVERELTSNNESVSIIEEGGAIIEIVNQSTNVGHGETQEYDEVSS